MIIETNTTEFVCSLTPNLVEIIKYATPIIAIIVTGIIASKNIKATSRNLFIQMNQPEIVKNMNKLVEIIQTGNKKDISDFLDSINRVYIPEHIRKKINENLEKESDDVSDEGIDDMINLISGQIFLG